MHVHVRTWVMARAAWRVRRAMGVPAKPCRGGDACCACGWKVLRCASQAR